MFFKVTLFNNFMLNQNFFNRDAEIVARELLGKIIVRKIGNNGVINELRARIVETEAYFDENDPASRARQNGDLRDTMKMKAGTILVYGVHANWLVNIVTGDEGVASAVLIRAVEPLNFLGKCNGPGLLTKALKIGKEFHKKNIINNKEIWIEDIIGNKQFYNFDSENDQTIEVLETKGRELLVNNNFEIIESFRIGIKKDLEKPLRFYIKDNKFVSRK